MPETPRTADDPFTNSPIDRRTFMRLSAATGAALALPGNATADVGSNKFDAEYQYVQNHTPADYAVPTLVTFSEATGPEAFDAELDTQVLTTRDPQPAAYANLTNAQAQEGADLPTAETFSHSPGANPFWRLGYYPLGVFPDPQRSTDYIDFEEMIAGLEHLESEHPSQLDFYSIGNSPGHLNYLSDREDPKGIYVAEVTNDINDEAAFEAKEKVMYSLSIHGSEREGVEAGTRLIENVLDGREPEIKALLDDVVLIFVYPNSDGWVAKHPQYESAGGAPGVPAYERGNAEVGDTNRQYPIAGWIDPNHYPAEPLGRNLADDQPGIDADVPTDILTHVPDALALADHFRGYENLSYGADLHGMAVSEEFILGLINQDQYDHRQLHELYEMNRALDQVLEEELGTWTTLADVQRAATGDTNPELIPGFGTLPEEAFDYSTIFDTLGYTVSGSFISWLAHPPELGGLNLTTMAFEAAYSGGFAYAPELVDMQVRAYQAAIRTVAEFAVQNSDTPNTEDQFAASVETGGLSTAYVTTDALTRSSNQLSFAGGSSDTGVGSGGGEGSTADSASTGTTRIERTSETVTVAAGESTAVPLSVPAGVHTLSVGVQPQSAGFVQVTLIDPDGETVKSFDPFGDDTSYVGFDVAPMMVREPEAGQWTVELATAGDAVDATVNAATMQSTAENPDPVEALGYEQRDYKVSPFVFFDREFFPSDDPLRAASVERDYDDVTDASVDGITVDDVVDGTHLGYDNLVLVHDELPDGQETAYLDALESFVEDGGNLVLTDTAVHLLGRLDTSLTDGITTEHVTTETEFYVAHLDQKFPGHPLLEDTREIQQMLWKIAPLGYSIPSEGASTGEAPMTLVDRDAFESAGGRVAGLTTGDVAVGTLLPGDASGTVREIVDSDAGSVQILAGLFPPAKQTNLHPFGMLDYALSFLGHTILINALGHVQNRYVDGSLVKSFGGEATFGTGGGPNLEQFTASGSRRDDGSVFTGGQTNKVTITVSGLSHSATVHDQTPDGWTVLEEFSEDVTNVEGNQVFFGQLGSIGEDDDPVELSYFVEAPEGALQTDRDTFGPATAVTTADNVENTEATFGGTDANVVIGPTT